MFGELNSILFRMVDATDNNNIKSGAGIYVFFRLALVIFVSSLPLLALKMQREFQDQIEYDGKAALWHQNAINIVEDFKSGHTYDAQINRMLFRMTALCESSKYTVQSGKISAGLILNAFQYAVPKTHRPEGTMLYAVSIDDDGGYSLLRGPGFSSKGGNFIGKLLNSMADRDKLSAHEITSLNRRCGIFFGDVLNFDFLSLERRLKLTPARFGQKRVLLYWNKIEYDNKPVGAFMAVFPVSAEYSARPVAYAMKQIGQDYSEKFYPVIVSLEDTAGHAPKLKLRSDFPKSAFKEIYSFLRSAKSREALLPARRLGENFDKHWVLRDLVSSDFPYELWLVSPRPNPDSPVSKSPVEFFFRIVFAAGWCIFALRKMFRGISGIGIRNWFVGFILVIGAIPTIVLFALGEFSIDNTTQKMISDISGDALRILEKYDVESVLLHAQYETHCRKMFRSKSFKDRLIKLAEESEPLIFEDVFNQMASDGFPLKQLLVFKSDQPYRTFLPGRVAGSGDNQYKNVFGSIIATQFYLITNPKEGRRYISELSAEAKIWYDFFALFIRFDEAKDVYMTRDLGQLYHSAEEYIFQYYDVLMDMGKIMASVAFLGEPRKVFDDYVRRSVIDCQKRTGRTIIAGKKLPDGAALLDISKSLAASNTDLRKLLEAAARSETTFRRDYPDKIMLAYPCLHTPGFVFAMEIPLADILAASSRSRYNLRMGIFILACFILLLSVSLDKYLFSPLACMERELRRVSAGHLDVRLEMNRSDEIGEVASEFDEMIKGFALRKDMGKFVSQTLDADVSRLGDNIRPTLMEGVILVSDLRSFTTISEEYPPDEVVEMLNAHLDEMSIIIHDYNGKIERFVGDAIFASFVASDMTESTKDALNAALKMVRRHEEIQKKRLNDGKFCYRFGIGINAGRILVGSFGSAKRMEQGILGDSVEIAERFEQYSRDGKHTRIIVSEEITRICPEIEFARLGQKEAWEVIDSGAKL